MRGDRAHDLTQKLMGHPAIFCNQLRSDLTAETLLGLHEQFSSLLKGMYMPEACREYRAFNTAGTKLHQLFC